MKEISIGNSKIKIIFPNQSKEENKKKLEKIYDVCNEIFKDKKECFYTHKELQALKQNPKNTFL